MSFRPRIHIQRKWPGWIPCCQTSEGVPLIGPWRLSCRQRSVPERTAQWHFLEPNALSVNGSRSVRMQSCHEKKSMLGASKRQSDLLIPYQARESPEFILTACLVAFRGKGVSSQCWAPAPNMMATAPSGNTACVGSCESSTQKELSGSWLPSQSVAGTKAKKRPASVCHCRVSCFVDGDDSDFV